MTHRPCLLILPLALLALTGCARVNLDIETVRSMRAQRPVELEQLEMLVGDWKTAGEIKMIGLPEPIRTSGTNQARWECDRRFLVERASFDMGPLGPMTGMSLWTWDECRKRYQMWWFDSFGESASGTAIYDPSRRTWRIRTKGRNGWCTVISRGTIKQVDDNTLAWTWTQRDGSRIFKLADMHGTSRRK